MKRALVVLLALVMGAGLLFAADAPALKWQGWVRTGAGFYTQETGTTFEDYNYDRVGGDRIRLAFSYTSADSNYGFYSRLSLTDLNWSDALVKNAGFHRLYGWGKLFDGKLTIKGGLLDDYTIATADWNSFGNCDAKAGLYFNVAPMEGLNVGFFQALPNTGAIAAEDFYNGDIVGASYVFKDIGKVALGGIFDSTPDATSGNAVYFGFSLSAIKNLTAILEAKAAFYDGSTPIWLEQNVGYTMSKITAGARVGETYDGTNFYWGVEPTISYKVTDKVTAGLIANLYNNKSQTFMSPIDAGVVGGGVVGDVNVGVGASITYTVGGVRVVLGDYYAAADGSGNIAYLNFDVSF